MFVPIRKYKAVHGYANYALECVAHWRSRDEKMREVLSGLKTKIELVENKRRIEIQNTEEGHGDGSSNVLEDLNHLKKQD